MAYFNAANNGDNEYLDYDQDNISDIPQIAFVTPNYSSHRIQTPGGHLASGLLPIITSNYSLSSGNSPVSPSATNYAGFPAQLPLLEEGMDYNPQNLYSPVDNVISQGNQLFQVGQWQPGGLLGASSLQVPQGPTDTGIDLLTKVNQLKEGLQLWTEQAQDVLPRFDETCLWDLKNFLKGTFGKLDASIQARLDLNAPAIPPSQARYCCRLCRDNPHVYGSMGTFKRHVTHRHRAEFRYRCFHNGCRFDTPRRDKFGSHLRRQHQISQYPTRNFLDGLRNLCPSPKSCAICHIPVSNWKAWFECVARHCRLPSGGSPATSTSQSRRNSGNSGGDGPNFSESQPFGNGGSNENPPSFGGNDMGGSDFGFVDQPFNYHGGSQFQHRVQANSCGQTGTGSPHATSSPGDCCDLEPTLAFRKEGPVGQTSVSSSTSLRNHHLALSSALEEGPASESTPAPDSSQKETPTGHPARPENPPDRKYTKRIQPGPIDRDLQSDGSRNSGKSLQTKCATCGHVMESCIRCMAPKELVRKCHLCAGGTRQQIQQCDQLHDAKHEDPACSFRPGKSGSSGKLVITESAPQISQNAALPRRSRKESEVRKKTIEFSPDATLIFSYIDLASQISFLAVCRSSKDGNLNIFTPSLASSGKQPFLPFSTGPPHARVGAQDTMTMLSSLDMVGYFVYPTMLMSRVSNQFHKTLLGNLVLPSVSFKPEKGALAKIPSYTAAVQKKPPRFMAEIYMQLLEESHDSTNPAATTAIALRKRRPHLLQTRLRVIVKLLKLKTTIANMQTGVEPEPSEVILEHPNPLEIIVDIPTLEINRLPSWLLSLLHRNAGFVADLVSSAFKNYDLDAHDNGHLVDTVLADALRKLSEGLVRPVRAMLTE